MKLEPADTIIFKPTGDGHVYSGSLTIHNISANGLAYKLKTTHPKQYIVKPNHGYIEPKGINIITFQMTMAPGAQVPLGRFMVQGLNSTPSLAKDKVETFWKDLPAEKSKEAQTVRLEMKIQNTPVSQNTVPTTKETANLANESTMYSSAKADPVPVINTTNVPPVTTQSKGKVDEGSEKINELKDNIVRANRVKDELSQQLNKLREQQNQIRFGEHTAATQVIATKGVKLWQMIVIPVIFYFLGRFLTSH